MRSIARALDVRRRLARACESLLVRRARAYGSLSLTAGRLRSCEYSLVRARAVSGNLRAANSRGVLALDFRSGARRSESSFFAFASPRLARV